MAADTNPSSWRDVYSLVRDSRADVLEAVGGVDKKVDDLTIRVNAIEVARASEAGQLSGANKVFGVARNTLALIVSIVSAGVAFASIAMRP